MEKFEFKIIKSKLSYRAAKLLNILLGNLSESFQICSNDVNYVKGNLYSVCAAKKCPVIGDDYRTCMENMDIDSALRLEMSNSFEIVTNEYMKIDVKYFIPEFDLCFTIDIETATYDVVKSVGYLLGCAASGDTGLILLSGDAHSYIRRTADVNYEQQYVSLLL